LSSIGEGPITRGKSFAAAAAHEEDASMEQASADCVRCSGSAGVMEVAGDVCAAEVRAKPKLQIKRTMREIARQRMDVLLRLKRRAS
jgi:hypothetical protein